MLDETTEWYIGRGSPQTKCAEVDSGLLGPRAGALEYSPYLRVKLTEVVDVPDVGHMHPVLVSEPEHSGPAFFHHTEGSFPHW